MRIDRSLILLAVPTLAALTACDDAPVPEAGAPVLSVPPRLVDTGTAPAEWEDWGGEVKHVALDVDVPRQSATARFQMTPPESGIASFEAQGLDIVRVHDRGEEIRWFWADGRLDVFVPPHGAFTVEYGFDARAPGEGFSTTGSTFVYPEHCGNLLPCRPDPQSTQQLALQLHGLPYELMAVYPSRIDLPSPAWQVAWATGQFVPHVLGETASGTRVVSYTDGVDPRAELEGTMLLVPGMDFYEAIFGPYPYGEEAGPVEVDWGGKVWGGVEAQPYWHVDHAAFSLPWVQLHLAAHAWFGGALRPACWEDQVLAEGASAYMAARVLDQYDPYSAALYWYDLRLNIVMGAGGETDVPVWPETCGVVGPEQMATAMVMAKGAWFFRDYGEAVGDKVLDRALGAFVDAHTGEPVGTNQLMHHLHKATGVDPTPYADTWLMTPGVPDRLWAKE
jgi:hypothetical protein